MKKKHIIKEEDLFKVWNSVESTMEGISIEESNAGVRSMLELTKGIRKDRRIRLVERWSAVGFAFGFTLLLGIAAGRFFEKDAAETIIQESYIVMADNGGQVLPDGSTIWMENGSRLHYSSSFLSDRTVHLQGNADFHVRHLDGDEPFYVKLESGTIKVTGTSFSVIEKQQDGVSIVLHEGKVSFSSADGFFSHDIEPGQQFTYNMEYGTTTTKRFYEHIHWTEGNYHLDNVGLGELVDFLNWKYGDIVSVRNVADNGVKMNGIVGQGESPESAIDKICFALKLKAAKKGGKYTLYR